MGNYPPNNYPPVHGLDLTAARDWTEGTCCWKCFLHRPFGWREKQPTLGVFRVLGLGFRGFRV